MEIDLKSHNKITYFNGKWLNANLLEYNIYNTIPNNDKPETQNIDSSELISSLMNVLDLKYSMDK